MKKILLLALVSILFISAYSKTRPVSDVCVASAQAAGKISSHIAVAVPDAVLQSFVAHFGNIPVKQWKLRSDGNWRAHFTLNGIRWEATFKPDGTLVKSEPA